jgi:hypothetical protein
MASYPANAWYWDLHVLLGLSSKVTTWPKPPALRVTCSLDEVIERCGNPAAIGFDNGPEYIVGALLGWGKK